MLIVCALLIYLDMLNSSLTEHHATMTKRKIQKYHLTIRILPVLGLQPETLPLKDMFTDCKLELCRTGPRAPLVR